MSQTQLSLYDLVDDNQFYALLHSDQNCINSQTPCPLTTNTVPITTPNVSTNQNYPTTHGSKRERSNDTFTSSTQNPVHSKLSDVLAHDQNTAKKIKSSIVQPTMCLPHGSPNRIRATSTSSFRRKKNTFNGNIGTTDKSNNHLFATPSPFSSMAYPSSANHSRNFQEDIARSSVTSTPLGLAPATATENFSREGERMPSHFANQLGQNTFQHGNIQQVEFMPNLSLPVTTTGTPTVNTSLLNNYRAPQGNQILRSQMNMSQGDHDLRSLSTQDLFLLNADLRNTSEPMRGQSSDVNLIQGDNNLWTPMVDPSKTQESHFIPHIVIDDDFSSRENDAISPMSSTSTGYSSYRSPRSPLSRNVTCASTANAWCEVLNPKIEYSKNQKKFQGPRRSEQRVQCGVVQLKILTKIPLGSSPVEVYVKREPKAAQKLCQEHPEEYTMEETQIPEVHVFTNEKTTDPNYSFCYRCELDLDSVYLTDDGKKEVYKLVKSKGTVNNLFQILLKLFFNDGTTEKLMPYEFVLKSSRTPSQDNNGDHGLGARETIGPKSDVSCRHIQAETAKITNIHCERIQTDNHDIAYFMKVKCKDEEKPTDLEKGDVVAFLEDDEGDTYIDFLTSENVKDARLAGVISRTAFLQGRRAVCDPDHVDSDLVCIIGEVDVKVHGKVRAGDLIYTSNCILRRGTAVARNPRDPEIQFDDPDNPRPTLLGMAMETYHDVDIKLVRCLVSVVLGIGDLHQRQTLEELRNCNDKIVKIQKYLKGVWKKLFLVLLFLLVAGTLCYVFLAPKSPYLIMKCEEGCIRKRNKGSCLYLIFDYFPKESQEIDEIVGINFKWGKVKKKLKLHFSKFPNETDIYYYLNKNRCVTGNMRAISSWLDTTPQVPRVNVLAVNKNCSDIYYYSVRDGWIAYDRKHFKITKCGH